MKNESKTIHKIKPIFFIMYYFISIILTISFLAQTATANPMYAGNCPAGEAAPGGVHVEGTPGLVGPLSEGQFVVTVGGVPVANGDTMDVAMLDFDITVTAEGVQYKGILIRVGGTTADQVTSADLTAPASLCKDVGSVTHNDASLKTVGTAVVSLDEAVTLDVDISVVVGNSMYNKTSTFYYSAFQLRAVGEQSPEEGVPTITEAPAMTPEATPVDAPAETPAEVPIDAPVEALAPVAAPTSGVSSYGVVAAFWVSACAVLLY